jgi:hypothetical protein
VSRLRGGPLHHGPGNQRRRRPVHGAVSSAC